MPRHKRIAALLVPAGVLTGLFAIYLAVRPLGVHVSDSYAWVNTVNAEEYGYFFHPHHVLYIPLAWRWSRLFHVFAPDVSTWASLAALSAVFGCAGVAAFFKTLKVCGTGRAAAAAGASVMAFAFGYWFFSSEPEVYVVSAACGLWGVYFLARFAAGPTLRMAGWAGVSAGFAALFHQTGIFLFAPAVVVFLAGRRRLGFFKATALFTGCFAAVVVPVYLAAAWAALGTLGPGAVTRWVFLFAHEGYGGFSWASPAQAAVGFGRAIVGGQALLDVLRGAGIAGWYVQTGIVLAAAGALALAVLAVKAAGAWKSLRDPARTVALAALVGFLVYGLFSVYFDAGNFEWWTIPSCLLALAVAVSALSLHRRAAVGWAVSAALLVGSANFILDFSYRRNSANDHVRNTSETIVRLTSPDDLIVLPAYLGSLVWYENRDRQIFCPAKAAHTYGPEEGRKILAAMVDETARRHGRIVILDAGVSGETQRFTGDVLAGVPAGRRKVIGSVLFFDGGRRLVRTVGAVDVIAVDADDCREGIESALVARAEAGVCR